MLVNPYDVEQTADTIYNAFRMAAGERRYRMRRLRRNVRSQDIFWWVDSFMRAAIDKELLDFPVLEEYQDQVAEELAQVDDPSVYRAEQEPVKTAGLLLRGKRAPHRDHP